MFAIVYWVIFLSAREHNGQHQGNHGQHLWALYSKVFQVKMSKGTIYSLINKTSYCKSIDLQLVDDVQLGCTAVSSLPVDGLTLEHARVCEAAVLHVQAHCVSVSLQSVLVRLWNGLAVLEPGHLWLGHPCHAARQLRIICL